MITEDPTVLEMPRYSTLWFYVSTIPVSDYH